MYQKYQNELTDIQINLTSTSEKDSKMMLSRTYCGMETSPSWIDVLHLSRVNGLLAQQLGGVLRDLIGEAPVLDGRRSPGMEPGGLGGPERTLMHLNCCKFITSA